ncbi:hypothetical protein RPG13_31525 [Mesorhizobium sp. ISC15]
MRKRYHPAATPCQRLLADPRTPEPVRPRLAQTQARLDPVKLLREMRSAQRRLVDTADGSCTPALDPLVKVTGQLRAWFVEEPWRTSRELLVRLQAEQPGQYPDQLLRTLQRRLKIWRKEKAHAMVFGPMRVEPAIEPMTH